MFGYNGQEGQSANLRVQPINSDDGTHWARIDENDVERGESWRLTFPILGSCVSFSDQSIFIC